MAAATLPAKGQLRRNLSIIDNEAEYDNDYDMDQAGTENANAFAANDQLLEDIKFESRDGDLGGLGGGDGAQNGTMDIELSDQDAEGDDDEFPGGAATEADSKFASDVEMAEAGNKEADSDDEGVGAVKLRDPTGDIDEDIASAIAEDDESSATSGAETDDDSDSQVEVDIAWEAEKSEQENEDIEAVNDNCCVFCDQDESHDPSPEFEFYLACTVCGDNAHRQCARDHDALKSDDEAEIWRCPGCVSNALQPETVTQEKDVSPTTVSRRSGAPKLARDLLPATRGTIKPDSHSVFNKLIVDEDPMDGSRLLRKRKQSTDAPEDRLTMSPRKRRRGGYSEGNRPYTGNALEVVSHDEPPEADQESGISEEHVSMAPKSLRSSRPSTRNGRQLATISRQKSALLLELHLKPNDLSNILSRPPVPKKKRSRSVTIARRPSSSSLAPSYLPGAYSQPFYALHDKELDELKGKPYGGILSATEADTTKTLSQPEDRRKFDNARQKAEEEWQIETANSQAALGSIRKPKKISGPASQIECINFGGFEIDTWYAAPYPEEYSRNRVLFICEYCLKYMNSEYVAKRHKMKCPAKHPPGDEIYREASISVFEVDGRKNPIYCQNLCLLAKLFLGSKTLYYDVEPFLFYVMTECDDSGCHFVGYFSKEKRPSSQNNVSCILTLPIHQRKGYGNLLIDFSYLLTRVEKKSGSPEKPLSDMGLVSYRNYWRLVLCYQLLAYKDSRKPFSVADLSESTGMTGDDIVSALEGLRALVRDPITKTYALRLDFDFFEEYIHKWESKNYVRLNPNALVWTPYVMGRNNQHMIEHAGAMNAIAARDDDDDVEMGGLTNGAITANGDIVEPASAESPRRSLKRDINGDIKRYSLPPSPTSMKSRPSLPNGVSQSTSAIPKIAIVPETAPESIPPSRFEIFPPINGRLGVARPRPIATPRLALTPRSPARRPRPSVSRRSTISKPRSAARSATSTRKRPPGGTGRGPGRWPKGTKKSDFGGADSGPGLPPRLLKEREESLKGDSGTPVKQTPNGNRKDESDSDESILYETPARRRAKAAATSARRRSALGKGKAGKGKGKARGATADSEDDFVVGDVEIEDDDDQ